MREPLGPRGPDVVLLEHLEHAGAADARDQRRLVEAEREGGQHHVAHRAHGVREHRNVTRGRQPAQAHGEEVDEVEAQPEAGDADAEQRDQHEPAVPGGAPVGCRDRAGRHADGDRDQQRGEHQHERGLRPLPERLAHGAVEEVGLAEIAAEDAGVEADELLVDGPVEAEALSRRLDLRGRGVGAQHHADRVTRDQVDEQEDDGDDDGQHGQDRGQPSQEIGPHASRLGLTSPARRCRSGRAPSCH